MTSTTQEPPAGHASKDWFDRLVSSGAHYGVDMEQRVVRWSDSATQLLGPEREALGRRCYEVTAALDPRNASRCRPNCAVIAAARHGQAYPDFEVYLPPCAAAERARVSVMLVESDSPGETLLLHVLQPQVDQLRHHDGPGELRAMLQHATARPDQPQVLVEERPTLTSRQHDVLARLAAGESPRQIAHALGVRQVTVRNHIQGAMDRLGAHSRLEAVLAAANAGLL